ncbi:Crp/Fnr family transcriptional regulator [Chryseobacterium formosus]|uniref:Crp/Fnr family transcriptional regulator n=1 Tax=Chryseobacterium formosus TaxID=1537363 RepID=A0ABT3XRX4_9FLAO|nr:Crp/Fnr family transcriptional regulator [Chryseobacterium formosus]MCX8524884.1 Crp/Fnr family transcriptional regulator [Chryseobacterium formosus]
MVISHKILENAGAVTKNYTSSENIFTAGESANHYFQIVYGNVKMNNYDESGKESIQHLLEKGDCIGESLLFINRSYPMNAVALNSCEILSLTKEKFLDLLKENPKICFEMNKSLSEKLYFKQIMAQNMCTQSPTVKLKTLMDYMRSFGCVEKRFTFQIPLTRQQMANLTGLCVETVIRALKKMERDGKLLIENGKILY